jgi:16S rRNA (cytidine1402-2'-O)-methyltransferase
VLVAFESPRRLADSVRVIADVQPERLMFVAREMTKRHERSLYGTAAEVADVLATESSSRGECVVVLGALAQAAASVGEAEVELVLDLVAEGVRMKRASQLISGFTGVAQRELYDAAQTRRDTDT